MILALAEVRMDAFIQVFGLANIEYFSRPIFKEINPWLSRDVFCGITTQHCSFSFKKIMSVVGSL